MLLLSEIELLLLKLSEIERLVEFPIECVLLLENPFDHELPSEIECVVPSEMERPMLLENPRVNELESVMPRAMLELMPCPWVSPYASDEVMPSERERLFVRPCASDRVNPCPSEVDTLPPPEKALALALPL
jgi:hypothetical protein